MRLAEIFSHPLRLLISIPPRHGKSELISHWLPVWFLANWPKKHIILASYEADFAASWGRKVRDTIQGNPSLGIRVREDVAGAAIFQLESGGGMVTAGVGGPITGRGGDLIIVDDPIKNWQDANSIVYRQMLEAWWDTTLWTRREPGASVVVVMARWHRDDLIGWLRRKGGEPWEYIEMPALATGTFPDVLGRAEGEPLWPERYSREALEVTQVESREVAWAALYQQHPEESAGDCYFDVQVLSELLKGAKQGEVFKPYVVGRRYAAGVDCAGQGKDRHSLSILDCQTGEYVVDLTSEEGVPQFAVKAFDILGQYRQPFIVLEANGVGLAMIEAFRRLGYPLGQIYQRPGKPGVFEERLLGAVSGSTLRDRILVDLAGGISQGALVVYSKAAIDEMFSFQRREKGSPSAAPGAHDDRVFAMGWAHFGSKQLPASTSQYREVLKYTHV